MAGLKCTLQSDVYLFPESLDDYWRTFDDTVIRFVQSTFPGSGNLSALGWLFFGLSKLCAALLSIECIVIATFALYAGGYDSTAVPSTQDPLLVLSILATFITQVPKRFAYRTRPFATDPPRARGVTVI